MNQRTIIQNRLGGMQRRNVGAFEELPNWDLLAPKSRTFHRCSPITRVEACVIFELFDARTEPLISIVVVVGNARAEDIDKGEAFVFDPVLDQLGEVLLFATEAASDERRPGREGQRNRVDRGLNVAERHALGFHSHSARGGSLAGSESVNLFV